MDKKNWSAIVLAAGKGKRMKSDLPKVLHQIAEKPLIYHIINKLKNNGIYDINIVVGHLSEIIIEYLKEFQVNIVLQKQQLGTAHAVNCSRIFFENKNENNIIIINGDTPLLKSQTISKILNFHNEDQRAITVVTSIIDNSYGYGKILRNSSDSKYIKGIVEEKDANLDEKKIKEINTGIYCVKASILFDLINHIKNENVQNEYYLTDIVTLGLTKNIKTRGFLLDDFREGKGINSKAELSDAEVIMQDFLKAELMESGVQLIIPNTVYIGSDVKISGGVIIEPNCIIKGKTVVEEGCFIGGFSYLENSFIKKNSNVEPYSKIINRNIDILPIKS